MNQKYDVIVIGYGPGGEVLTSTLGEAGLKVLVVERWPTPYPLPRLTTLCGECCRVIQSTGINIEESFKHTLVQTSCNFVDENGAPVLRVPFPGKLGGWPSRVSMFQPDIEKSLADKIEGMPNVTVMRGWEGNEMWFEGEEVHLIISPTGGDSTKGSTHTVKAKYIVGADGARSFVRQSLSIGMTDYDLHERWLNFDAENLTPIPEKFMHLDIYMDPKRPHMYMPIGKRGLRMEFRVMEGENDEDVTRPGVVEDFMESKYGLNPKDFKILRRVVYHYRQKMAQAWRVKRAFLLGDAAHLMPPYMGQGAAAAIRDGRNLGWKLIEVLFGRSSEDLLDEYQKEREPHFRIIQAASSKLSDMVNMTDPIAVEARNASMRSHGEAQPPELPSLEFGVLHHSNNGELIKPAGLFSPQGILKKNGKEDLGDNVLGGAFQLWSRRDPSSYLSKKEISYLQSLDFSFAVFEDDNSPHTVKDIEKIYTDFMNKHEVDIVIIRPDFYVFGGAKQSSAKALINDLALRLYSTLKVITE